jgi:hypothetical protein
MSTFLKFCVATSVTMSFLNEPVIHPVGALKLRMFKNSYQQLNSDRESDEDNERSSVDANDTEGPLINFEDDEQSSVNTSEEQISDPASKSSDAVDANHGFSESDRKLMDDFLEKFWTTGKCQFWTNFSDGRSVSYVPYGKYDIAAFIAHTYILVKESLDFSSIETKSTGENVLDLLTKLHVSRSLVSLFLLENDDTISRKDKEAIEKIKSFGFRYLRMKKDIPLYEKTLNYPLQLNDMTVIGKLVGELMPFYEQ